YDSHPGEGAEQSEEGESEEVEGKEYSDEPSPSSSPEPTGIPLPPLPPSRSRSNTPQAETPRIEPNSPSPSTSEDSFFWQSTTLIFTLSCCLSTRGMLYGGYPTIPSEKDIPGVSLGITSDGFFDLEQPKRVAVVGPVEFAGVFNNRLSKLLLVTRVLGAIFYIFKPHHRPDVWKGPTGTDSTQLEFIPCAQTRAINTRTAVTSVHSTTLPSLLRSASSKKSKKNAESHWHRSPLAHCDPRLGPAPYANHSHLLQLLRPASPHLGWEDSVLMVADLQKAGMALVDAVKQTKTWLLRSSEKLLAAGSAAGGDDEPCHAGKGEGDFASASGEQGPGHTQQSSTPPNPTLEKLVIRGLVVTLGLYPT
ncbi:hypothetical protein F5877DRAFT_86278, partial [Lentinula edodes]